MKSIMLVCLAAVLALGACRQDMESVEKGNPAAGRRILIAGSASDFKLKVSAAAIAELGSSAYYFKVVGLDGLAQEDAGRYGALVLMDAVQGNRLDKRVQQFVNKAPADRRVIVFFTRGGGNSRPAGLDSQVDALAAASEAGQVEPRGRELAALISARF